MSKIGQLELEVQSSSTTAVSGIDALASSLGKLKAATKGGVGLNAVCKSLTNLNTALSGIGASSVTRLQNISSALQSLSSLGGVKLSSSIASQITGIGTAVKSLDGTESSNIIRLANALSSLGAVGKSNLTSFVTQITRLPAAMQGLESANMGEFASNITQLTTALAPLSNMGKNNLTSFITQLGKIPKLMTDLKSVDMTELTTQIQQLANAFAPLATQMQHISAGFASFPSRIQKLIQSTDKLSVSNEKSAKSYVNLAAKIHLAYNAMKGIVNAIAGWITKSNQYIEDMNLFTVAMGEYANSAQAYAEKVSSIVGIDSGAWMRDQGIFMTLATGFGVASDRAAVMSQNLTQLGYDLSSFFNISVTDAMAKLQSGLAGELEPLRRLGYDLSVARLQQEAYTLGIQKKVTAMTQAEKAELRYHAILTQVTKAQGDMARTLDAPSNQLRVLQAQTSMAARALGNIFIPILNAVLPYAIALAKAVRIAAEAIASFFGYSLPQVDFGGSSIGDVAGGVGELEDNASGAGSALDKAAKEAKELKNALLGIDELNIISPPEEPNADTGSSGGGGGSGGAGGAGGSFDLPTYDFLGDLETRLDDVTEKIKAIAPIAALVGGAFATWKVSGILANLLGVSDVIAALTVGDYLKIFSGVMLAAGGAVLYFSGAVDALKKGLKGKSLAKLLGGLATATAGVFLVLKPFSTVLAPIAAAATAAAGGLGILAISLNDVHDNGSNLSNTIGLMTGLAVATAGVAVAFRNSKLAIAPVLAPLVAFAGSLAIIKTTIADIVKNGASVSNVFTLIAAGVATVTAGVWLFNAACSVNPIFGIAAIAVGIVAGIASIASAFKTAGEEIYASTTDFQVMEDIINRSANASERCADALVRMQEGVTNLQTVGNDFAVASQLLGQIMAINENADASAYELAMMQTLVGILNGLNIDGLSLSIDATTGRVVESREAVEALIESLQRQAQLEALQGLLVQSYRDQYQAAIDATQAMRDYEAASQAVATTAAELDSTSWFDFTERAKLNAQLEKEQAAVDASKTAYNDAKTALTALNDTIATYTQSLTDLKTGEGEVGTGIVDGVEAAETGLVEAALAMPPLGSAITGGLVKGMRDAWKDYKPEEQWGAVGTGFTNMYEIHSPSKVFEGYGKNIIEGLEQGLETYTTLERVVTEWGNNLKRWFTGGDEGALVQSFAQIAVELVNAFNERIVSSSLSSRTGITTWAANVKNWFSASSYGAVNANTFRTYAANAVDGFRNGINSNYPSLRSVMETFGKQVVTWFTKDSASNPLVSYDGFYQIAKDTVTGFSNGIGKFYETCRGNIEVWGESIIEWFKAELDSHSPSKVFEEIGRDTVLGYNLGISGYGKSTAGVVNEWADSFTNVRPTMSLAMDTSAMKYYNSDSFARSISANVTSNSSITATGFKEGMEEFYREYVEPTMAQMATDMRRQADKNEQTVVQIGNRTVSEAVNTQRKANGYVFAK